jgi:hypothetical protein
MNPEKTAILISRYESGLLYAAEIANTLLYDLLTEPEIDESFLSSIWSLPDDVRHAFVHLLRKIRVADFQWTPILLRDPTVPMCPSDPAEHSAKLRQICTLLDLDP